MAFDGIVTKSVLTELSCLISGKISKIYQPNKNEILLGIYANGKNYALTICIDSLHYRMHLTTSSKPNPMQAPNFCMLLRKHLIGMRIISLSHIDLERIITIEIEGYNELNDLVHKKLIIELMGKHSNIILVNENNRIIDSMRHLDTFSNATRNILPSYEYVLPTSDKISFLELSSFEEFHEILKERLDHSSVDTVIPNTFIGISKLHLHYLCQMLSLPKDEISLPNLEKLYTALKELTNPKNSELLSCTPYLDPEKKKEDYVAFIHPTKEPLFVNFFLDDFYTAKEQSEEFIAYRNSILKLILNELKKFTKRFANMNQKLEECNTMDTYRLYGELLTFNLYRIKNENIDSIVLENYYENNTPITVPLDKKISPSYNAKKYFKKYAKLKNTLEIVSLQKKETAKEITYLESIIYELEGSKTIRDVSAIYEEIAENVIFKERLCSKKAKKKAKPSQKKETGMGEPLQTSIEGYTVYIGKNNKQNDYLTLKLAHGNDLWFHTKDIHGSHVILKAEGKEIEESIINRCASLAAYYSKASCSSNVPVDYTRVRYVKKPSGAKPGMVIYTNHHTVNVQPLPIENV